MDEEVMELPDQEELLEFIVDEENAGNRIDKYLSVIQSELTRSYIQKLIEEGRVFLEEKPVKANSKVKTGQRVSIQLPEPIEAEIVPEDLPINILYEDKDIIIVNKQKGMVVHPAAGHASGTLVNALLYHCKGELSGINGVLRPGIVHRIDRDTTGILVACKNDKAHQFIAEQLKVHSITRKYQAIVYHTFKVEGGRVEGPIGRDPKDRKKMAINHKNGKPAATNYRLIENLANQYAHIECSLETGRTHQIRFIWQVSIIRWLVILSMVRQRIRFIWRDRLCTRCSGLHHPSTGKYVEFLRLCLSTLLIIREIKT
jgi:23S rRNA pseudouridine1911/1915/1917 synthase